MILHGLASATASELPAEDETFFDTFSLTSRLGEMQQRIDALEKQVAELKAGK